MTSLMQMPRAACSTPGQIRAAQDLITAKKISDRHNWLTHVVNNYDRILGVLAREHEKGKR